MAHHDEGVQRELTVSPDRERGPGPSEIGGKGTPVDRWRHADGGGNAYAKPSGVRGECFCKTHAAGGPYLLPTDTAWMKRDSTPGDSRPWWTPEEEAKAMTHLREDWRVRHPER